MDLARPCDRVGGQRLARGEVGQAVETTPYQVDVRLYLCSGCDGEDALYSQLDVWSSAEAQDIAGEAARLKSTGLDVSTERLRAEGISEAALRRLIVVEFGGEWATFRFMHIHRSA